MKTNQRRTSKCVLFRLAAARESAAIICFLAKAQVGRGMGKLMVEKREGFRCTLMAVGIGQL